MADDKTDERTKSHPVTRTAEEASQGQIVLTTPTRRAIFAGGLIGLVVLLAIIALAAR